MSDVMWRGLELSALGMGLTFAALGLVIVVIILLQRLFSPQPTSDEPETEETLVVSAPARDPEGEIVAAIAVALAHLGVFGVHTRGLGAALEAQRGAWWMAGRAHQHLVNTRRRYSQR